MRRMHVIVVLNDNYLHRPVRGCDVSSFQNGMTPSLHFIGRFIQKCANLADSKTM